MTELVPLLPTTGLVILAAMSVLWLVSVRARDASIVDLFWGPGFAVVAVISFTMGAGHPPRKLLITAMAILWGARLGLYLLWRNWGKGEDPRYAAMRRHHGHAFIWVSLFTVFLLQGGLMWVVSLPLQVAQLSPTPARLTWLDGLGASLWTVGMLFEAVGDWQLARFLADPGNRGKVLDAGLWAWTRHPNYFGNSLIWWGIWCVAAATPSGWLTLVSPALMTFLLLKVSGVALLERSLVERRPAYREYAKRTSAFIPLPPKRRTGSRRTGSRRTERTGGGRS